MEKIIFEDATLEVAGKVTIDGKDYPITEAQYVGGTDLNAKTFNDMQDNIEKTIDGVVESGSNENGSWTKWADGTMICEHRVYSSQNTTVQKGAIYLSELITLPDFPVEFVKPPIVALKYENADWSSTCIIGLLSYGYTTTTNVGQIKLVSYASTENNGGYVTYIAKGKWK